MLDAKVKIWNGFDVAGNPAGGMVSAEGLDIRWQDGPLKENDRNGTFVETVLFAALRRLEFYQDSKFACKENADAIEHIKKALQRMDDRTLDRNEREVEGENKK